MFFLGAANREGGMGAYNQLPDHDLDESVIGIGKLRWPM